MGKSLRFYIIFALFSSSFLSTISGQETGVGIFDEVDKLLENAKVLNAQVLSPTNYSEGLEYYNDAQAGLKNGDNINDIRADIERAHEYLRKANEVANLAKETFADLIQSRTDAETVNASISAPDQWEYGVESFRSAAEEFESGYIQDAQEIARESEKYFRDAELIAIKQKLLGPTWNLLSQAEDLSVIDYAPITLSKSKLLIQQAESELNNNRYNNDRANEIIDEAFYEAKHAIYMAKLFTEMIEKDKSWEDIKLSSEVPIKEICEQFNLVARFDSGYDEPKNKIIDYVKDYAASTEKYQNEIVTLNKGIDELTTQLDECKKSIISLNSEKKLLEDKLAVIDLEEEDFQNVSTLFSISEAEVLKDGKNIVIRLLSLNFAAGKSIIDPQYFSLLSKVQKAIMMFPSCTVSVEGHTDSQGAEDKNLTLSQERADAVRQYLLANLEIYSNKILAIGYGETKPIANNESEDGRRKNRRIDIVINPDTTE